MKRTWFRLFLDLNIGAPVPLADRSLCHWRREQCSKKSIRLSAHRLPTQDKSSNREYALRVPISDISIVFPLDRTPIVSSWRIDRDQVSGVMPRRAAIVLKSSSMWTTAEPFFRSLLRALRWAAMRSGAVRSLRSFI